MYYNLLTSINWPKAALLSLVPAAFFCPPILFKCPQVLFQTYFILVIVNKTIYCAKMADSKLHLCLPSLLLVQYKLAITSLFISLTLTLYLSLSLCNFLSCSDELSCFLLFLSYHLSFGPMEQKVGHRWPKDC